jgi:hypothetical protein
MVASETESSSRTRRVAATTIELPGGDTMTFSFTGDIFGLSPDARELVYGIVDKLKEFEASLPVAADPIRPTAAPKAKAPTVEAKP